MNDTVTIRIIGTVKYEIKLPKDCPNKKEEAIKILKSLLTEKFMRTLLDTMRVEEVEE